MVYDIFDKNCDVLRKYHDEEWGTVLHDDQKHFEYLLMEAMQCGLSWNLMLKKREIFRKCFDGFDYRLISLYKEDKITQILETEGMIRSRRKVEAIINNAKCFLNVIEECGSFDTYLWSFSEGHTLVYDKHQNGEWEAKTELSDLLAKDMKKRGFKYLGSLTLYAHLQACGMVNDHERECYKYQELLDTGNILFVKE